jgi:hypothetical protein
MSNSQKIHSLGGTAILLGALTGCGSDNGDGKPEQQAPQMQTVAPSAETRGVWAKLDGYQSWPKFPENQTRAPSESHMNMLVLSYYNEVVGQAMTGGTLPLPEGAIIVKDNFASATDAMPMAITVMAKQNGQWYWLEATPNGEVIVDDMMDKGKPLEGNNVVMCVGCHNGAKSNDFVFTHKFGS